MSIDLRRIVCFLISIIFGTSLAAAQVKTNVQLGDNNQNGIVVLPNGNTIIKYVHSEPENSTYSIDLFCYDSSGNVLWDKKIVSRQFYYYGIGYDTLTSGSIGKIVKILLTKNGVLLIYSDMDAIVGQSSLSLVEFNQSGEVKQKKKLNFARNYNFRTLSLVADTFRSCFYINVAADSLFSYKGRIYTNTKGFALFKIDNSLNVSWVKIINGLSYVYNINPISNDLALMPVSGDILLTTAISVVRIDHLSSSIKYYYQCEQSSFCIDNTDNIYTVNISYDNTKGQIIQLHKFNPNLVLIWSKSYYNKLKYINGLTSCNGRATFVLINSATIHILAGSKYGSDAYYLRLDTSGKLKWQLEFSNSISLAFVKEDVTDNSLYPAKYSNIPPISFCLPNWTFQYDHAAIIENSLSTNILNGDKLFIESFSDSIGSCSSTPIKFGTLIGPGMQLSNLYNTTDKINYTTSPFTPTIYNQRKNKIIGFGCNTLRPNVYFQEDTIVVSVLTFNIESISNGRGRFVWNNADTTTNSQVNRTGTYWIQQSLNGYTKSDTIYIVFLSDFAKIPDAYICPNSSVKLRPIDTNYVYQWYSMAGNRLAGQSITATDSQTYYLSVRIKGKWYRIDTVQVRLYLLPTPSAGPDTLLCYRQSYTLQGAGGVRYKWTPAKYLSNDTIANPNAVLPAKQRYTLTVSNEFGCVDSATVFIDVRPKLKLKYTLSKSEVCLGDYVLVRLYPTGGLANQYSFSLNGTSVTDSFYITPTKSGMQQLMLSDNCSESISDSFYLRIYQQPIPKFELSGNLRVDNKLLFINTSRFAKSYVWYINNQKMGTDVNLSHTPTDTGIFTVKIQTINALGCADSITQSYKVIDDNTLYIPNSISPNADGLNDQFHIVGINVTGYEYEIFNRWGQIIHRYNGHNRLFPADKSQIILESMYCYRLSVHYRDGSNKYLFGCLWVQ